MGQLLGDQFVMVFDLRMMKLSLPLRALVPPLLLRFVPGLSSCLAVVSPLGQWQLMDAGQPDNAIMSMNYQVGNHIILKLLHWPSYLMPNLDVETHDLEHSDSQTIVTGIYSNQFLDLLN